MAKTLAPVRESKEDSPSRHLVANQEVAELAMRRMEKKHATLVNKVNDQLVERPESPFIGEIVLYKLGEGPGAGRQTAAIVLELLESEGNTTRCVLKVLCNPDRDGTGVLDEANVPYGTGLNEWLPCGPQTHVKDPDLANRVAVGETHDG